ncbi:MAG: AfsR/SARP family transcriptional regulator, partial [Solirubrobacterales bacterium]|nr:AfsR/SARP family transcriptional regulator [Solirubrobacterales bacterium]
MGAGVQFRVLGPFEVLRDDAPVALGGAQARALLAVLLLHRGEVVSADRLIDALWPERPPATAAKTVQVYVSRLRRVLGDGLLATRGSGYALTVEPEAVDADRFRSLASEARGELEAGDARRAATLLAEALGLWRGPPLAEFAYAPFAQAEIARLEEARLAALEARIEAELELGRHSALVSELEGLVREHPLRERLQAQLMLALYRSGRQA